MFKYAFNTFYLLTRLLDFLMILG